MKRGRGKGNFPLTYIRMFMEIQSLGAFDNDYKSLWELWNQNFGFIYPITSDLFSRNIINHPGLCKAASFVAFEENRAVGYILVKTEHLLPHDEYNKVGWISLFLVDDKYRKKGIGTKLLEAAETVLKERGVKKIHLGRDYDNFFPGLPFDLKQSAPWFEKRGFRFSYSTHDLIRSLDEKTPKLPIVDSPYTFRQATKDDFSSLRQLIVNNWPTRWLNEFDDYLAKGGTGDEYFIALDKSAVCAFCKVVLPSAPLKLISYSSTWRARFKELAGIGPLGVDRNYRGRHLGYNIVASAVNHCIGKATDIIIDWTNLIDFYRQFGFEIWKSYMYFEKEEK